MVNEHAMHHVALKAGASNFFSSIMPHNFWKPMAIKAWTKDIQRVEEKR